MFGRYTTNEFEGEIFWTKNIRTKALFFVEIDNLSYGKIKGHFYCDDAKLLDKHGGSYFLIKPVFKFHYGNTIELRKCALTGREGLEVNKYYFDCLEYVNISTPKTKSNQPLNKLGLFFYISFHPVFSHPKLLHEDLINLSPDNKELVLTEVGNTTISTYLRRNRTAYSIDSTEGTFEDVEQILSIKMINADTSKDIGELVGECKELIQDLLILFSFYTERRIQTYRYSYSALDAEDKLIHVEEVITGQNKRTIYGEGYRRAFYDHFEHFREFIQLTFPGYLKKKDEYNLSQAIWDFVSSFDDKYVEARFMHLCTSLEALKDGYYKANKNRYTLEKGKFTNLKRFVKKQIKDYANSQGLDDFKIRNIIGKLDDLRRPAFRVILEAMIECFKVRLDDLEKDNVYNFIPFRHELFHSGKVKGEDYEQLIIEVDRLRILIGRLILRIIDCPVNKMYHDRPVGFHGTDKNIFSKDKFYRDYSAEE